MHGPLFALLLALSPPSPQEPLAVEDLQVAARVSGESFREEELELMLADVRERLASFERLRAIPLQNDLEPALYFLPWREQRTGEPQERKTRRSPVSADTARRPEDLEELAFASIPELARLIHAREVSCVELTELFLARLARFDETLLCVVELTEARALEQAVALDRELANGTSRGMLHGIPWVAKDLLAVRGTRTTWGAAPFEEQELDLDATVVRRLDEAGAVLIAKVSLGALAWGDVWFGGRTRNPWNPEQGSSGSSAGPASAVAAGCAPFGIGSETLGSIVSPSTRCGNTSVRPTFGRVSRFGAMTLSWSMDKLGPMCRSAVDAALVLDAIHGADPGDPTTVWQPFDCDAADSVEGWKVGYWKSAFPEDGPARRVLEELGDLGVELVELELPAYPVNDMSFVLSAEAATAFDDFSRSDQDDALVRQERFAWPNVFRHARLIPAVDYLRANRLRTLLTRDYEALLREVDAIVHPSFADGILTATNLSGHPTVVAPCRFTDDGMPDSISFTARLFGETRLLQLVRAWQSVTDYHLRQPELAASSR